MSQVTVIAIEPFNGHEPGDRIPVTEREAKQLVDKGLAKMQAPHSNKMKAEPANKANPSPAAGEARRSSASRAALASRQTIARPSVRGARKGPTAK